MPLIYRRTSIFDSPAQTLVNTVNCVGVMGKGLAKEFKKRDPEMFRAYKRLCDEKQIQPGVLWLWRGSDHWTLNFPTKIHWRNPSQLEWIEAGLKKFVDRYESTGIREISFPRLGCGNGDLDWSEVKPLMEHYLSKVRSPVFIHDYMKDIGLPEHVDHAVEELRQRTAFVTNFPAFVEYLRSACKLTGGRFAMIGENEVFRADFGDDGRLGILTDGKFTWFDEEELRGVWVSLQNGLLTEKNAEWSEKGVGLHLVSLVALLPNFRPIEIQRMGADTPEIAIERSPDVRLNFTLEQKPEQRDFAWA